MENLHRDKPLPQVIWRSPAHVLQHPATTTITITAQVTYKKPMPDIETLMQVWPAEFEDFLKEVSALSLRVGLANCDWSTDQGLLEGRAEPHATFLCATRQHCRMAISI